jgi:hypothetical protein
MRSGGANIYTTEEASRPEEATAGKKDTQMLVQRFTSQLQYGACGHLICTPVSCALAVLFLNGGCKALTPPLVHDTMVASHQLVMSTGRAMMMLSEIQDRLPVEYAEVRVHTPHTH